MNLNLNLILKKFKVVIPYLEQIKGILEKRTTWIISTILLAGILGIMLLIPPVDTSPYYDRINYLEEKINTLNNEDILLSQEVDSLQSIQQQLEHKNLVLQHQLNNLTQSYEEDIAFVDTASTDELTKFFTERYRYLLRKTP